MYYNVGRVEPCEEAGEMESRLLRAQSEVRRLDAILNSIPDGLCEIELSGRVVYMNPAALELHGFRDRDDAGRSLKEYQKLFEIMDTNGMPVSFEDWPWTRAWRGEKFMDQAVYVRRKDKSTEFMGNYSGAPVLDKGGMRMSGIVLVRKILKW